MKHLLAGLTVVLLCQTAEARPHHLHATPPRPAAGSADESAGDEDEDDDGPAAATRGTWDYVRDALLFRSHGSLHESVDNSVTATWFLGALLAGVGGHLWAPLAFYKEIPANEATSNARLMGILATLTPWAATLVGALAVPLLIGIIPYVGWVVSAGYAVCCFCPGTLGIVAFASFFTWFVWPRAISWAYSDAYTLDEDGGGTTRGKKHKKAKRERSAVDDELDDAE